MSVCTCCQPACHGGKSLLLKHTLSPLKSIWVYLSSISGHCYPPACIPCFIMLNLFFIYTKSAQKLKCPQLLSLSSLLIPLWKTKIFWSLTMAEILQWRIEQHGAWVNSPFRRVCFMSVTPSPKGRKLERPSAPHCPFICVWMYSQSLGGVLSYSMCPWLWGGAPWKVNIGQAGEGRRLHCVWLGLRAVCQTHRIHLSLSLSLCHFSYSFLILKKNPCYFQISFFRKEKVLIICSLSWNKLLLLGKTLRSYLSFFFFLKKKIYLLKWEKTVFGHTFQTLTIKSLFADNQTRYICTKRPFYVWACGASLDVLWVYCSLSLSVLVRVFVNLWIYKCQTSVSADSTGKIISSFSLAPQIWFCLPWNLCLFSA